MSLEVAMQAWLAIEVLAAQRKPFTDFLMAFFTWAAKWIIA